MTGPGGLLVLCGDWEGVDTCGVAHSERALLADGPAADVVDPTEVRTTVRALRRARRSATPVLLVYPSRSTVARVRPLLSLLAAAVLTPRSRLRLHLHEYRIFREVRWAIGLVLLVGRPRVVVVSSASEVALLRRSVAGRLGFVRPEVIPPYGPLTPAVTGATAVDAAGRGVVGVFGFAGPAKGADLIVAVLRALPSAFRRLELVGSGWDGASWPADVRARYEIVGHGFVPSAQLGPIFAGWELAVAPFSTGATDGRSSLRIPLSHGVPTITTVVDPADLTVRSEHLVVVADGDVAGAVDRAVGVAADPTARRRGAEDLADFEGRVAQDLRAVLLDGAPRSMVTTATGAGRDGC